MNPNVAFDGAYDPSKSPWRCGETKRKELEYKDPDTAFVPNTKGKIFVVRPIHGNTVEGIGDVRGAPPHGPRNGAGYALYGLHFELRNLEETVEAR